MRKVCVVITARATYGRIRSVLEALRGMLDVRLQVVAAASALLDRFGNAHEIITRDGFEISARVHMVLEGGNLPTMAKTTGLGIIELATAFENLAPDIVVTVADRYETLATAVAASYMNIPVAHVQGGEVTGSIDEKVRHAVTKLADLHLVSTERAADRVRRMGEDPARIFQTGCPSIDLAARVGGSTHLGFDAYERYGGVGPVLDLTDGYIVVLQHPVTTEYELSRRQVLETLHAVRSLDMPVLWFWPNVDAGSDGTSKGIRHFREQGLAGSFHFFKNMDPLDFLRLLHLSRGIVGNSSVGIRECSFLGVGAVNVGSRQEGRERGANVIDVGHDREAIADAVRRTMGRGRLPSDMLYGDGRAGERIAGILRETPLTIHKRLMY